MANISNTNGHHIQDGYQVQRGLERERQRRAHVESLLRRHQLHSNPNNPLLPQRRSPPRARQQYYPQASHRTAPQTPPRLLDNKQLDDILDVLEEVKASIEDVKMALYGVKEATEQGTTAMNEGLTRLGIVGTSILEQALESQPRALSQPHSSNPQQVNQYGPQQLNNPPRQNQDRGPAQPLSSQPLSSFLPSSNPSQTLYGQSSSQNQDSEFYNIDYPSLDFNPSDNT